VTWFFFFSHAINSKKALSPAGTMSTFLLKIFRLLGRTRETRFEKDGTPLEHWKILQENHEEIPLHHKDDDHKTVAWKPIDPDFWENHLSKQEHKVLREKGTESARSSVYDKFYPAKGFFSCRACGLELYAAQAKFDSGTGWPSFGEHVAANVEPKDDFDHGMKRTELRCRRCKSHLGHVFAEKNSARVNRLQHYTERQCINGMSIYYMKTSLPDGMDPHATAFAVK
jgi:peptide-methionine (R)-S-oxide reductase